MKKIRKLLSSILLIAVIVCGIVYIHTDKNKPVSQRVEETKENITEKIEIITEKIDLGRIEEILKPEADKTTKVSLSDIPEFSGKPYVAINGNVPFFKEVTSKSFESYANLDSLGRCGVATASVGIDLMPTEERGSIGSVKPSGWHTVKYDCVDGKYLYNRCHLIGYQLTGENANKQNLITGTRYLNIKGMLPFENMVADYVKETKNHVMLRVTPIFEGDNLLASGVLMEAKSVEDDGEGILFNVYCYNVQPNVVIDYKTGLSEKE